MGLSSKQVSSDRNGWNKALLQGAGSLELPKPPSMKRQSSQQQQQQQPEALKCPRCDSANTKFCYYNNYNKSQPRHFCKACKRHWTKGGTLRNVPVGGGRKNKRQKTSNTGGKAASKTDATTNTTIKTIAPFSGISTNNLTIQATQPRVSLQLLGALGGVDDHKNLSETFYHNLVGQLPSSLPDNSINFSGKSLNDGSSGFVLGSNLSLSHNGQDLQFPYANLGDFESNPCSISSTITSIQSSNLYNYTGEANGLEETVMNSLNTSSSSMSDHHQQQQHWTVPTTTTSSVMDMSSNWGWDDFDKFVSVEGDLTMPWDDTDIKP